MELCRISIYLAYAMVIYCAASAFYVIRTRSVGTPFKDSLTPKQIRIKKDSSTVRRNIFLQGLIGSAVILFYFQPFKKCI